MGSEASRGLRRREGCAEAIESGRFFSAETDQHAQGRQLTSGGEPTLESSPERYMLTGPKRPMLPHLAQ
jgi:hypothetical protein